MAPVIEEFDVALHIVSRGTDDLAEQRFEAALGRPRFPGFPLTGRIAHILRMSQFEQECPLQPLLQKNLR